MWVPRKKQHSIRWFSASYHDVLTVSSDTGYGSSPLRQASPIMLGILTSRYARSLHTILVYDSSFIINIFYLWLLETDSITSGSLRKLPLSNVGHGQTTMFSCTRIFQPMLQQPQKKRVFAELLKKDSESHSAIHKLALPPPPRVFATAFYIFAHRARECPSDCESDSAPQY